MTNTNEWVNYGDVNPMEHGGQWVRKDSEEFPKCYYIITWSPLDGSEANGIMAEGYVNMTDTWFDWSEVADYADWANTNPSEEQRAIDLFEFHGAANFGGSSEIVTVDEMVQALYDREIRKMQE